MISSFNWYIYLRNTCITKAVLTDLYDRLNQSIRTGVAQYLIIAKFGNGRQTGCWFVEIVWGA